MDQAQSFEMSFVMNSNYWKTLPGIIRGLLVISGLLAIALIGSEISKSTHLRHEFLRDDKCVYATVHQYIPQDGLIKLAFSIIVLAWIFTLAILIVKIFLQTDFRRSRKIYLTDTVGHVICGFLLAVGFLLVLIYVIQIYQFQNSGTRQMFVSGTSNKGCATNRKLEFRPANLIAGIVFNIVFGISAFLIAVFDNYSCVSTHRRLSTMDHQSTTISQSHLLLKEAAENPEEII